MRYFLVIFSLVASLSLHASEKEKQGEFLGAKVVDELPNWFKATFMDFSEDLELQKSNPSINQDRSLDRYSRGSEYGMYD